MRQTQAKTKALLETIGQEGLNPENALFTKEFVLKLDAIIQDGSTEYGQTNISTPESRCYEDAIIAKNDLVKALKERLTEWHKIIQLLDGIVV